MRLPLMTTRRWMMLAACIALLLAAARCWERRAVYLAKARINEPLEHLYSHRRNVFMPGVGYALNKAFFEADGITMTPEYVAKFEKKQAYFAGLVRKYRYAAAHPWVYVEPGPPEPH